MLDKEVSVSSVAAYTLWCLSIILLAVSWAIHSDDMGRLAIIVCAAGATTTVRGYHIALARKIQAAVIVATTENRSVTQLSRTPQN